MRPSELGEWAAFWNLGPWGAVRGDLQAGIIASTVANANRDSKKRPKPFRPDEFMPFREPPPAKPVDSAALSRRLLSAFGLKPDPKNKRR